MLHALILAAIAISAVMWLLWWRQTRTRDASVVDAAWALGIGGCAIAFALLGEGDPWRRILVGSLAAAWGLRLGGHLLLDRVLHARAEDSRYRAMRDHWGASANAHFAWFFQAQALAVLLFAVPAWVAAWDPRPVGPADALAGLWWLATLALVTLADRQLAAWRADPANAGRTCRGGLWARSRHPNYFFEWLHWFSYPVLAWGGPWGPATLAVPALLFVLLRWVTGIPYVEARALAHRGEDYRAYQREVPMFVPRMFP